MEYSGVQETPAIGIEGDYMFHKAKTVTPLSDYRLLVHFANGKDKEYDMNPLFDQYPVFLELKAM